jgi:hypothetical protein
MLSIKMAAVVINKFKSPLNKWDKNSIRPGPVGSVGDALTSIRIKQSDPDADFAWNIKFGPNTSMLRGSNVQDGNWASFSTGGYNAQTKRKRLNPPGTFSTEVGWTRQNIIPEPREMEPKLLDQPGYGWKSQAAEIMQRQGDMFTSLPGGYGASELTRGGAFPSVVSNSVNINTPRYLPSTDQLIGSVVVKEEPFSK